MCGKPVLFFEKLLLLIILGDNKNVNTNCLNVNFAVYVYGLLIFCSKQIHCNLYRIQF